MKLMPAAKVPVYHDRRHFLIRDAALTSICLQPQLLERLIRVVIYSLRKLGGYVRLVGLGGIIAVVMLVKKYPLLALH